MESEQNSREIRNTRCVSFAKASESRRDGSCYRTFIFRDNPRSNNKQNEANLAPSPSPPPHTHTRKGGVSVLTSVVKMEETGGEIICGTPTTHPSGSRIDNDDDDDDVCHDRVQST